MSGMARDSRSDSRTMTSSVDNPVPSRSMPGGGSRGPSGRSLIGLVVEGDLVHQEAVRSLLEERGHVAVLVDSRAGALEALSRRRFDFVLMDVEMPVVDGVNATNAIREKEKAGDRSIPIIVMTAHAMKGDRETYLAAGADAHVSKPIDSRLLLEAVETLTGAAEGRPDVESRGPVSDPDGTFDVHETLDRFEGDAELLREVVGEFATDARTLVGAIQDAWKANDVATLSAAAHALRGAASNFGATSLTGLCRRLEHLGDSGERAPGGGSLVERLPDAVERLVTALRGFCESRPG